MLVLAAHTHTHTHTHAHTHAHARAHAATQAARGSHLPTLPRLPTCPPCSILMFLAHILPLSERSGVNLKGDFNTSNVTGGDCL